MCDGAVKPLADNIRPEVWFAYGTMEMGDTWQISGNN
jgi:hypothetical protein